MEALAVLIGVAVIGWFVWDLRRTSPNRGASSRARTEDTRPVASTSRQRDVTRDLPPKLEDVDYVLQWFESEDGKGYTLHRLRDDQRLSWQKLDPEEGLYAFYVRLDSDLGDAVQIPRFGPGSPLQLRREIRKGDEVFSVWGNEGDLRLGWVMVGDEARVRKIWERSDDPHLLAMWERLREDKARKQVRALLIDDRSRIEITGERERLEDYVRRIRSTEW